MTVSIKHIPNISYAEVSQKSPMRWCVLKVEADGSAVGQHSWWKCKDFLNDSVMYLRTGKEFPMYGYSNKLVLNDFGAYVALKSIPDFFEDNLGHLNNWLVERGLPEILWFDHDEGCGVEAVIGIPKEYWDSTFAISAITSLIRSCVYKKMVNNVSELFAQEPTLNGFMENVDKIFKPVNFPMFNELIYKNYQYDGKGDNKNTYTIHNAGLQSWINSPGVVEQCK